MKRIRSSQSGVALILVIFVVTLSSILVVNLAYSTYLNSRVSAAAQRSIQAEYLLKSMLGFSQVLVDMTSAKQADDPNDFWAQQFYDTGTIPNEWLGINESNIQLRMEIRPAEVLLNLNKLADGSNVWFQVFDNYFRNLLTPDMTETDKSGLFPGKFFPSNEVVASLIDYQDADTQAFTNSQVQGYDEARFKDDLKNQPISSFSEISRVPGLTPSLLARAMPYLTIHGSGQINMNLVAGVHNVETAVLNAIDPNINAQNIYDTVRTKPYTTGDARLNGLLTASTANEIRLTTQSNRFQVIATVDYGTSKFFLRAQIDRDSNLNSLPVVKALEIF